MSFINRFNFLEWIVLVSFFGYWIGFGEAMGQEVTSCLRIKISNWWRR